MQPRKVCLPEYSVTELAKACDADASRIVLPNDVTYFVHAKQVEVAGQRRDGKAKWVPSIFQSFPIIFQGDGKPWDEANVFLFKRLENTPSPNMGTFIGMAEDLAAYRRYLESVPIDWLCFPAHKLARPTYRYRSHLVHETLAGKLKASTANRKIGVVVRFYRWMIEESLITPDNPPWKEEVRLISTRGDYGQPSVMKIKSTDLRIDVPKQDDPTNESIYDGGKLRPLSPMEQDWIVEALEELGNTELTLIHLFALVTGARIQTILTLKVRNIMKLDCSDKAPQCPVGPGTGVDTKNNKKLTLFVPPWFCESLLTYGLSERARKRRLSAIGGDTEDQYLFLSVHGAPMYVSKQDKANVELRPRRHRIAGQAVRQNISDSVIPLIREKHDAKFHYRFHDLRASYGMNIVDHLAPLIDSGKITYTAALNFVRVRLGHESLITTERYLKYRANQKMAQRVQDEWESRLQQMAKRAMG